MKLRHSLYLQIFTALFLYLSSLAVLGFIAFNAKFGIGWEALYNSPAGERVEAIAESVASQLRASPRDNWSQILKNFQHIYGSRFYLFDMDGEEIAGESVTMPKQLKSRIVVPHPWFVKFAPVAFPREGFTLRVGSREVFFASKHHHSGLHLGQPNDFMYAGQPDGPPLPSLVGQQPPPPPPGQAPPPPPSRAEPPVMLSFSGGGPPPPMMPQHQKFMVHTNNPDRFWFVVRVPLPLDDFAPPEPVCIVASPDNLWQSSLLFDFKFVLEAFLIAVALSLLFWCPLVYSITRALSDLTAATEKIADGKFETRLTNKRRDEIGRLATAVNTMALRLEGFVLGQKRLLGDISHELFTPIARLQMAIELLDTQLPEQHKELLNDIREEVSDMNILVGELLAFSKAGVKGQNIELKDVALKQLFEKLTQRLALTDRVKLDVPDDIVVLGDPMLLDRSFGNVLRNSVRYANESIAITVVARLGLDGEIMVVVDDDGPGVPDEALPHIGPALFRPESARARESGGAGLGLAIVKTCIESCKGTVAFRNRSTGGFEVEIRLLAGEPARSMKATDEATKV